jgi:hypothetical protein
MIVNLAIGASFGAGLCYGEAGTAWVPGCIPSVCEQWKSSHDPSASQPALAEASEGRKLAAPVGMTQGKRRPKREREIHSEKRGICCFSGIPRKADSSLRSE